MTNQNSKMPDRQRIHDAEQIYQRLVRIALQETLKPNPQLKNPALDLNVRVWRQAVLCRVKELGGAVLDLHRQGRHVTAAILARSLLETVALYYHIFIVLKEAIDTGNTRQAVDKLWQAGMGLHGGRKEGDKEGGTLKQYDAIEVKEFAKEFCALAGPARWSYDQLSEIVHPNCMGCVFAYAQPDRQNLSYRFGKDFRHIEINYDYVLEFALGFLELHYAEMDKLINEFMKLMQE